MRAIDGDALRDRLRNLADDEWNQNTPTTWAEAFYACADIVADAPAIEPEPQWIPCSERLPEEEQNVLVTRYFILPYEDENPSWYVEQAEYCDGQWYSYSDDHKVGIHYEPIAWMPLPEAYKEGGS